MNKTRLGTKIELANDDPRTKTNRTNDEDPQINKWNHESNEKSWQELQKNWI